MAIFDYINYNLQEDGGGGGYVYPNDLLPPGDFPQDVIYYTISPTTLPAGLFFDPDLGGFYGYPTEPFFGQFTITGVDSAGTGTVVTSSTFELRVGDLLPGALILAKDYNDPQALALDILGQNEQGWGFGSISSSPVSTRNRVSAQAWNRLLTDLDAVSVRITSTGTGIVRPTTGTLISTATAYGALTTATWLADPLRRWTCHESQYYVEGNTNTNRLYGTSTRVTPWIREITHRVRADFPTRKLAQYFFNQGGVYVWQPTYLSSVGTERDQQWAQFIDWHRDTQRWEYRREQFVQGTSTNFSSTVTVWTSGTLSLTVEAIRYPWTASSSTQRIDFLATYRNEDAPWMGVNPNRGYWNYGPWEALSADPTALHVASTASLMGCYSGQGGFSLDRVNGQYYLYMGLWPSDIGECLPCDPDWLAFDGTGINRLGADDTSNRWRQAQGNPAVYNFWTITTATNLSAISTGSTVDVVIDQFPYNLVAYTYRITKTSTSTVSIQTFPYPWDSGDYYNNVSVLAWWNNMQQLWGGVYDPFMGTWSQGTGTFSW